MNLYYLFAFLLVMFGVLNPVAGNKIDSFAGFFVVGLVSVAVAKNSKIFLLLLGLASVVFFTKAKGFDLTVVYGLLAGFGLSFLLEKFKAEKYRIFVLMLAFLVSSFVTSTALRAMLTRDLPLYTYNNDPGVILKTYKLMEDGTGYYDAFAIAQKGRFGLQVVPQDVWGWRLPTIFEVWKVLPGKSSLNIYVLYLVLACVFIYSSYLLGRRYLPTKLAILPAYLVFPYLHFAARDQMVLETEWWGVTIFFLAVFFAVRRNFIWATLLFALTVMIREVYILPLFLMLVYSVIKRREFVPVFSIPTVAFFGLFLFHLVFVGNYIDVWGTIFAPRVIPNGLFFVQQTLSFASWEYMLFPARPFMLFLALAVAGCWYIYRKGRKDEAWFWLLSFLSFPVAFLRFGTVPYNDYWGVMYMPIVLVLAPIFLGNFMSGKKQA